MLRNVLAAGLLGLLVAASGCKSNLWADVSDHPKTHAQKEEEKERFLGVVVADKAPPLAVGVRVERVLRSSPAEQAGIRPGDEIRGLGGQSVRTASDLDAAIRRCTGDKPVEVVVAREGEQWKGNIRPTTRGEQKEIARERLVSHAKTLESTVRVPFLLDYQKLEVKPDMWRDYLGQKVIEPVVLYRDIDIVPLLGIFSLFRLETAGYRDAWRLQLLTWPLKFQSIGNVDDREDLAPGEEALRCL